MKRFKVSELRSNLIESTVTRGNILTLLESITPPEPYIIGLWKDNTIVLPDGVELKTKVNLRMGDKGLPVKVYNKDGEYSAIQTQEGKELPIELTYVINESIERVTDIIVFD